MQITSILKPVFTLKKHKPHKILLLGLAFFVPFFSSCDNIPTSNQNKAPQHTQRHSILPQDKNTTISNDFMQIKLLGSLKIYPLSVNSIDVTELSDLAWDEDEQRLYAVSDEGLLYHLKISLIKGKLNSARITYVTPLKDMSGKALKGKYSDSEGLEVINSNNGIKGDSQLIVSFEHKPRIAKYATDGSFISAVKLPKYLRKKKYYRSKNKALESVTVHPVYGILTAAEYPLKKYKKNYQSLYSASGKIWHFPASQAINSAVTGLEILANGDVLVLERAYQNPIIPININLRRIKLNQCNKKQECQTETIAHFNGSDGWLLDNFEGLTHFKDNKYFIVSDDNANPFQKTILVLFEIKPTP